MRDTSWNELVGEFCQPSVIIMGEFEFNQTFYFEV